MASFIFRRLLQAAFVMLAVAFIAFAMFTYAGDPVANMLGIEATEEQRLALTERLGLNDSLPVQFFRFVQNTVQGEFGVSYRLGAPVGKLIAERLPATLELVLVAVLLSLSLGIPLGVYTGLHRSGKLSRTIMTASLVGVSLPSFLLGLILILVFSVWLGWLPSFGRGNIVKLGWWTTGFFTFGGLRALVLPSITLALFQTTLIMRLVHTEMLEVLRTDYIKFARARGLTDRAIHFSHALRNTLIPVITITGLQIGSLIAFAIITETVFQWPGMGLLFLQAVQFVDIPVMSTYLVLISFFFVIINLCVDLLYYAVDPRMRVTLKTGSR